MGPHRGNTPRGDIDGLIAATAIVHDLILVTRNVKDFEDTDASVINPGRRRREPLGVQHPQYAGIQCVHSTGVRVPVLDL